MEVVGHPSPEVARTVSAMRTASVLGRAVVTIVHHAMSIPACRASKTSATASNSLNRSGVSGSGT